jgi:DNA-binding transcriptional LysR family regulator
MGWSAATVGRRIAVLEGALGVPLFAREPDGMRLTRQGAQIMALAEAAEERVAAVERAAVLLRASGGSLVRVSATEVVIADVLAPELPRLYASAPDLRLELRSSAEIVSLARHEADLAVRMVRPDGDSLLAKRLPALKLGLFASREYLRGRAPSSLVLERERMIGYDDSYGPIPEVRFMEQAGLADALVLRCTSTRALFAAACAGVGIALLSVPRARRDRRLVEIPAARLPPPRAPWLVSHPDSRTSPPIRAVARWVAESFERYTRG